MCVLRFIGKVLYRQLASMRNRYKKKEQNTNKNGKTSNQQQLIWIQKLIYKGDTTNAEIRIRKIKQQQFEYICNLI